MSITLKFQGFEDLVKEIEKANGSINQACESAIKQSAQIMQSELKAQMADANVPNELISAMPSPEIETSGNRITARVGYKKGAYNPNNLSTGYKVLFLNYGTPNRKIHGKIHEGSNTKAGGTLKLGFIQRAKKKARPQIKKSQEQVFKKILARLKK